MSNFSMSRHLAPAASMSLRQPNTFRILLLCGSLLPLGLDVKKFDVNSGDAAQLLMVALSIGFSAAYIVTEQMSRNLNPLPSKLKIVTFLWWGFIGFSPFPAILWEVNPEHYLKVVLPFILFGVGLNITAAAERRRLDPAILLDVLLCGCLLSTIWRALYAVEISGLSISTIRWQILGPGVPFLIGYGVGGLYLGRHQRLSVFALVIGLTPALISITRSYLISIFFVLGGVVFATSRRLSWASALKLGTRKLSLLFAVVLPMAIVAALALRRELFDVWKTRVFDHHTDFGMDLTLISRLAEYRGQIEALTRDPASLLFGRGIGGTYVWDAEFLQSLPIRSEVQEHWFAGHSTWVYPFFASGVVLGSILPLILIITLVSGYRAASNRLLVEKHPRVVTVFATYLAYLGQSFTSNIFHERYAGLIIGILVGCTIIYVGKIQNFGHRYFYGSAKVRPYQ